MPVLDDRRGGRVPGRGGLLLDARAGERYRGEIEPSTPAPDTSPARSARRRRRTSTRDGRFLPAAGCASGSPRWVSSRARPVGVYCGSGVTAAHEVAALAVAGIDAAL